MHAVGFLRARAMGPAREPLGDQPLRVCLQEPVRRVLDPGGHPWVEEHACGEESCCR